MTTGSYSFHVGEKAGINVKKWPAIVAPYARADHRRAVGQLLNTGLPFLVLMAALIYCWAEFAYLAFVLAPPAVFLLVRLFIIQHDCGHGSFFASRHPLVLFGLGPFYQFSSAIAFPPETQFDGERFGVAFSGPISSWPQSSYR